MLSAVCSIAVCSIERLLLKNFKERVDMGQIVGTGEHHMGTRMLPKPNFDEKGGHAEDADIQATVTQITGTEMLFFFNGELRSLLLLCRGSRG